MPLPQKNNVDFSRFVSIGDSLTAGYMDGALFYEGQQDAFPNLIAHQLSLKSNINFKQPYLQKNSVGVGFFGNARIVLKKEKDKLDPYVSFLSEQGDLSAFSTNTYSTHGPFNNIGISGAKAIHIVVPGYGNPANGEGNYNPFFTRMSSNPQTASVLSDAMLMQPTFFTLFIGNNDVLAHILPGGKQDAITPIDGAPGIGLEGSFKMVVNTLMANGAKGVIANLPNITSIPYFNTIPYNGLLLNSTEADVLNKKYNAQQLNFHEGANSFIVESAKFGVRSIEPNEFILLDILLDNNKNEYLKAISPIPKKYVLPASEIAKIQLTIREYNKIIKTIAQEKNLAFVDVAALLKNVKADRIYNSKTLNVGYSNRDVFSLDGVHINSLGQALLANEFIKAMNQTYGTNIPKVNITKYRGKYLV